MLRFIIFLLALTFSLSSNAQPDSSRFVFYNVENLFDTIDSPNTRDEEFLPEGDRHWNGWKYQQKLNKIYKTLMAVKGWQKLSLIGLCEIENRQVLANLIYKTPLYQYDYQIIHTESPDERGVDVALLYSQDDFSLLSSETLEIRFPFDTTDKTRDILYVEGVLFGADTLHLFLNHWPSRYGGYMKTKKKREFVASLLARTIDSVATKEKEANILIAGDFNDEPSDSSLEKLMDETNQADLLNLLEKTKKGTTKYRSQWYLFDQLIVSKSLLKPHEKLQAHNPQIGRFPFLLTDDERYGGMKVFRTFAGPRYIGGYSDHLPVFLDLKYDAQE